MALLREMRSLQVVFRCSSLSIARSLRILAVFLFMARRRSRRYFSSSSAQGLPFSADVPVCFFEVVLNNEVASSDFVVFVEALLSSLLGPETPSSTNFLKLIFSVFSSDLFLLRIIPESSLSSYCFLFFRGALLGS